MKNKLLFVQACKINDNFYFNTQSMEIIIMFFWILHWKQNNVSTCTVPLYWNKATNQLCQKQLAANIMYKYYHKSSW